MSTLSEKEQYLNEIKGLFEHVEARETNDDPTRWILLIRDKLYIMFRSPLKDSYSDEAFKWVGQLCASFDGFGWISPDGQWSSDEAKIFTCIAMHTIVGIQILIPPIQRHLTCGPDLVYEDDKVMEKSATPEDYEKFGTLALILEHTLKTLISDDHCDHDRDRENDIENRLLLSLTDNDRRSILCRLKGAFNSICDYLEIVHKYWIDIKDKPSCDMFSAAMCALRLLSYWLSEDPTAYHSQSKRFLIDLIIKTMNIEGPNFDLLMVALHSVCTQDSSMIEALKKSRDHQEAIEKYLGHVKQQELGQDKSAPSKIFKLRCGLIKDLMIAIGHQA